MPSILPKNPGLKDGKGLLPIPHGTEYGRPIS